MVPPPPPPPPLPSDKLTGGGYENSNNQADQSGLDLIGLESIAKPQARMRTLNWRRIPKRKVLSSYTKTKPPSLNENRSISMTAITTKTKSEKQTRHPTTGESEETGDAADSIASDEEDANVWLLIAKSNKWIRKEIPDEIPVKDLKSGGGVQPVSGTSSKGAARIREMLEAVRRRMAAVTTTNSPATMTTTANGKIRLSTTCDNSTFGSTWSLLSKLDQSANSSHHLSSPAPIKPKNVIDAIDFNDLESLFCLTSNQQSQNEFDTDSPNFIRRLSMRTDASSDSAFSSNSFANHSNDDGEDNSIEIENILDSKKSLNVNIFLKQLKSPETLINLINDEQHSKIGKEKLENLLKLLPDKDETKQLIKVKQRNKHNKLPVAERFLLRLVDEVPNLKLRIKFMLLQEEYCTDTEAIRGELDKIEKAAHEVRHSKKLRDILNLVLVTGNFLNSGGYAADAAGFGLDCLERLNEIRSNRSGVYLIHYVAEVANRLGLIDFQQSELEHVELASRVCIESIKMDLCAMLNKICDLNRDTRVELNEQQTVVATHNEQPTTTSKDTVVVVPDSQQPSTTKAIDEHHPSGANKNGNEIYLMHLFDTLESIRGEVELLRNRLTVDLELTRKRLAGYLCEDVKSFKLHDCFQNILIFSQRLKLAHDENERRRQQEASTRQVTTNKNSLKRSKTINPKLLPNKVPLRHSLVTGSISQQQKESNHLADHTRRVSVGYSGNYKQITSTPIQQVKPSSPVKLNVPLNASSGDNEAKQSYDDLHEGLMRLLIDTNGRRNSSFGSRQMVSSHNTSNRRASNKIHH